MKRKHEKKVEKAIIAQIVFRIKEGWMHDHDHDSCYMLPVDDCYDIISEFIHPKLKGWKRFQKLNERAWNTLSDDDVVFMDNVFVEEDWNTFYACHDRALRKITKSLSALL